MANELVRLVIILAVLIIAWMINDRFSPDPLITKIVQVIIFVIALVVILGLIVPMVHL